MNTTKQINETTLITTAIIAGNICNQIIEFQAAISARAEGSRFPTLQEVNLLCKLINCLDKLKKFTKQTVASQALDGFVRFLAREDRDLGKVVRAKFREYAEKTQHSASFPEFGLPSDMPDMEMQSDEERQDDLYEPDYEEGKDAYDEFERSICVTQSMLNDPSQPLPPLCSESQIDVFVLADHFPLLGHLSASEDETICINGIERNTHWIQYSIFQCTMHPDNQRFFSDEHNYHNVFNHAEVLNAIRPLVQKYGIKEMC